MEKRMWEYDYEAYAQKPQKVVNGYKIDTNVPIPKEALKKKRAVKYPFEELEIENSFFVPLKTYKQMIALTRYWSRRLKRDFVARSVEGGVRVWRRG